MGPNEDYMLSNSSLAGLKQQNNLAHHLFS